MQRGKRIIVATLSGILFGFVCLGLASYSPGTITWPVAVQMVISRTLIGFAIGISCISLRHWTIHGILMGLIFSLPLAFSGLMAPESAEYSKTGILVWTVILGMVYGLLIEVITSVTFKARLQS
jgi:hypothetical protein